MSETGHTRYVVARERMHPHWPTHACPAEFWEELGRTIAKFGFLEDCLKRANLAITATRKYSSIDEAAEAFRIWQRSLEKSLDESLSDLTGRLVEALYKDDRFRHTYVSEIESKLRKVVAWRNALCHGAWTDYNEKSRRATLRHWPKKGWREESERPISRADLVAIGNDAVDITCRIIEAVTANGVQFPGSKSPGEPAWPSQPEPS